MTTTQHPVTIGRLDEDQERLLELVEGQAVTLTNKGDNIAVVDFEVRAALDAGHIALVPDPARRVWQLTPAGVQALQQSRFARHVEAAAGLPDEELYAGWTEVDMDQPCIDVDPEPRPQVSYDTTRWTTVAHVAIGLIALITAGLIVIEVRGEVSPTVGAAGVGTAFLLAFGMVAALAMERRSLSAQGRDHLVAEDIDLDINLDVYRVGA